jgi:hypothetical protein
MPGGPISLMGRVSLFVCELLHIALPRIDLLCRFSQTETRRQWRVFFKRRPPPRRQMRLQLEQLLLDGITPRNV